MPKASTRMTLTMKRWTAAITSSWGGRLVQNVSLTLCLSSLAPSVTTTLFLPAPSGAVPRSRPHYQRHKWRLLRRLLLHLFPEVHSHRRGLLLPPELRMVNSGIFKPHLPLQNTPLMLISAHIRRYQSLNLNHVREHSMPIYEFRWRKGTGVMTRGGDSPCCPTIGWDAGSPLALGRELTPRCGGNIRVLRHRAVRLKEGTQRERGGEQQKISDRWTLLTAQLMIASIH